MAYWQINWLTNWMFTPCKGIWNDVGFPIPRAGYQWYESDSAFQNQYFRIIQISMLLRIPDSLNSKEGGFRILRVGFRILRVEFWILRLGFQILRVGFQILKVVFRISKSIFSRNIDSLNIKEGVFRWYWIPLHRARMTSQCDCICFYLLKNILTKFADWPTACCSYLSTYFT